MLVAKPGLDGHDRGAKVVAIVFDNERTGRRLFIRLARDITQRRQREHQLDRMLQLARQLVADPFRGLYYSDKFFDPEYLQDMAPVAAVSVGLALRRMHDR